MNKIINIFIVACCMSLAILVALDQTRISHGGGGSLFSSKNITQTGLDLIAVIIIYVLYKYFSKNLNFRPLRGFTKFMFFITAILFVTAIFSLYVVFPVNFPVKMNMLYKELFQLTTLILTACALWLWYQFLLTFQPKCETELNFRSQLEPWQLSPERIEMQKYDTNYGEALIIRPKEPQPVSEYYFIVLDGAIVAALKAGEFTKVKLQHNVNEIGCYAKTSNENVHTNYILNVGSFEANQREQLTLSVTPDIFVGSSISKISLMEAQTYQRVCNYVDPGPRHNTRLDQSAIKPPLVSL
jgi:hypothetical protein